MRRYRTRGAAVLVAAALSLSGSELARAGAAGPVAPARASLAVWDGTHWRTWWSDDAAPVRWRGAHPVVAGSVAWRPAGAGLELGSARFSGSGEAWRFNVILLRIDPAKMELALHVRRSADGRALPWSADDLPEDAAFAINAGMFDAAGPWGWLVLDGDERQRPAGGPLSSALAIRHDGTPRIVAAHEIDNARAGGVRWAVQSYPTALAGDGEVPAQLRAPGRGVDIAHRDARLAVAMLRDGRVLIALTRFDGLGGLLAAVPLGPTLPEMTAVLGALGAREAVFLDGGISAQMAVRTSVGVERWDGLRRVPLGLVGRRR